MDNNDDFPTVAATGHLSAEQLEADWPKKTVKQWNKRWWRYDCGACGYSDVDVCNFCPRCGAMFVGKSGKKQR